MNKHHPTVLIILDGWGYSENPVHNAIHAANKPNWDALWKNYPHTLIAGSGHAVGLPQDQMGNSEVGHLTMGAGRTVYQEFTRIDHAIENGEFFHNPVLLSALKKAKETNKAVHILGLLSPGGVHSHQGQIHAMTTLAAEHGPDNFYVHAFLDGRDTPPKSAVNYLQNLETHLKKIGHGKIASLCGRYYAMDRDKRWERIECAYELLTEGKAEHHGDNAIQALEAAYARGETDEFVKPITVNGFSPIQDGDVVIFMNYRADRARELTRAFIEKDFSAFKRNVIVKLSDFVSLTQYAADIKTSVAFSPQSLANVLGEYIAQQQLKQLRIAETEKYAHVTFFFNGGVEAPFPGEDRVLIPSAKIATYDLKPQMSAFEITEKLVDAIESKKYGLIVCNFANPDMVGHTGHFDATVHAIETIDTCLGKIIDTLRKVGGEAIITADHGNAECMYDEETRQPHTAHTSEPVPFIYIGRPAKISHAEGTLADIAPTLLYLMDLPNPREMTGNSLIEFYA
jgi:2,3-bisphosphoglycerate-independent phosphoglycerate mutase